MGTLHEEKFSISQNPPLNQKLFLHNL